MLFQALQGSADRGLLFVQPPRCRADPSGPYDFDKKPQKVPVDFRREILVNPVSLIGQEYTLHCQVPEGMLT